MQNHNTRTQAQGARRVESKEDTLYTKMLMDVGSINFIHVKDGVVFSVTKSGDPHNPFTVDIACGCLEFTSSIATYPEFQALVNVGLGYFLGVFDNDLDGLLPQYMSKKTK